MAAALLVALGVLFSNLAKNSSARRAIDVPTRFVGTLVAANDCVWDGRQPTVGGRLANATFTLRRGQATILFDNGARLVLGSGSSLRLKDG